MPARVARPDSCVLWHASDPDALVEDVAYDSVARRYFVTSVRHGGVVTYDAEGRESVFIPADSITWGTFAIGIDRAHATMWVTTFSFPGSARYRAENDGRVSVLEYEYPSGRLRRRWYPADTTARALGDLAIAPSGIVYVTASIGGGVYAIDRARGELRTVVRGHVFRSPQTPVVADGGRALLVPDYSVGIARVDVAGGASRWLAKPAGADLRGIDGLYADGPDLIAIQNGGEPNRIIRLALRGDTIATVTVLASGGDASDLNHAVVGSGEVRFIAQSGWARMSASGVMSPGGAGSAPQLRRLCPAR